METGFQRGVNWWKLLRRPGFPYLFAGMFISLFGTGMNFAGVSWYILERTGSPLRVSFITILVTLPGLVVPLAGGVLIDRIARRYVGMALDLARGALVVAAALLVYLGMARLGHIYAMVFFLGVGFAVYWPTMNALAQEVIPREELVGANSAVLIAVQGGMMTAGAAVGFVYERAGLSGILAIDALTYFVAAFCLVRLRRGYMAPRAHPEDEPAGSGEAALAASVSERALAPDIVEPGLSTIFLRDLREGARYLRSQPRVLALGLTYACMMAGVLSGNVLLVTLAQFVLKSGARGFGFMEAGWAFGAVTGGLLAGALVRRFPPLAVLIAALAVLAVGHTLFPYARLLVVVVAMQALFGACRALGGVLTQTSIMTLVPRRLMGRTQSTFSVVATLLQVLMSFSLGFLAERVSVTLAFLVLGVLYGTAVLAAIRARGLSVREAPAAPATA
ncbi:MAG: MFS transporter [Acidipila sp.]|nr:MFS transporter [Acidipila sp.]